MPFSVLLIGQSTSAGTIDANTLTQVFSAEEVSGLAGLTSMVHQEARRFFVNNKITNCYIVALDDAATSTAATRVVTITGTATETRELVLLINGTRVAVSVASADTATEVGDALVTALADYDYLPFTAVNVTGTVTFTAENKGISAGDNDIRVSDDPNDKIPAGISVSIAATTPGTVDPDIQDALDVLGDFWPTIIVNPYNDATNMEALETHLATQFGPTYQRDSVAYQAMRGSVSTQTTFSTNSSRNSPSMVLLDCQNRKLATWEYSAAWAGAVATSAQEDPAVPLHRIQLAGVLPNNIGERFILTERNTLAKNGVATATEDNGTQTEGTVTMYLKNSASALDTAYRYQNTMFILQRARYRFVQRILGRYARAKLMDSAERVEAGQQVITPELGKAEAIAWFMEQERAGQFEGLEQFKEDVICRRSESDPNRLEWILPPDLVNQFIVGSGVMQFLI
jgi:phage tail sheath gpL-like